LETIHKHCNIYYLNAFIDSKELKPDFELLKKLLGEDVSDKKLGWSKAKSGKSIVFFII
jgi:hypothetical protein